MKRTEETKVKGFVRAQIVDAATGKILGDSGFVPNTVVNLGFQDYVVGAVGGIAGSKQVSYMAIGTGTAPAVTDTSLNGETGVRVTTSNSVVSSKTLQCTAQFAGSDMGGTCTIQNVALANTSSGGTILAGTTFATSQWASNQNINATFRMILVAWKLWQHSLRNLVNSANIQNGQRRASKTKVWACVETRDQTPERDESIVRTIQECIEAYRNDMLIAA